jgi:hypothetical protein
VSANRKAQSDLARNNQDGEAVAERSEATTLDPAPIGLTFPTNRNHSRTNLSDVDLDLIRLSDLSIKERYGESFKVFDWSYTVVASPVPTSKGSPSAGSRGRNDQAIKKLLQSVFLALHRKDRRDAPLDSQSGKKLVPIRWAYCLETGKGGWRHAHVLLGSISRLRSHEVASIFRDHNFGAVSVDVWNPFLEKGYPFKSLDPSSPDYDKVCWDFNVKWNRTCKQQMKLHRSHLLRLADPNASRWVFESQSQPMQPRVVPKSKLFNYPRSPVSAIAHPIKSDGHSRSGPRKLQLV